MSWITLRSAGPGRCLPGGRPPGGGLWAVMRASSVVRRSRRERAMRGRRRWAHRTTRRPARPASACGGRTTPSVAGRVRRPTGDARTSRSYEPPAGARGLVSPALDERRLRIGPGLTLHAPGRRPAPGGGPARDPGVVGQYSEERAIRNPMFVLTVEGAFLLRLTARQLMDALFHEPPRSTPVARTRPPRRAAAARSVIPDEGCRRQGRSHARDAKMKRTGFSTRFCAASRRRSPGGLRCAAPCVSTRLKGRGSEGEREERQSSEERANRNPKNEETVEGASP